MKKNINSLMLIIFSICIQTQVLGMRDWVPRPNSVVINTDTFSTYDQFLHSAPNWVDIKKATIPDQDPRSIFAMYEVIENKLYLTDLYSELNDCFMSLDSLFENTIDGKVHCDWYSGEMLVFKDVIISYPNEHKIYLELRKYTFFDGVNQGDFKLFSNEDWMQRHRPTLMSMFDEVANLKYSSNVPIRSKNLLTLVLTNNPKTALKSELIDVESKFHEKQLLNLLQKIKSELAEFNFYYYDITWDNTFTLKPDPFVLKFENY